MPTGAPIWDEDDWQGRVDEAAPGRIGRLLGIAVVVVGLLAAGTVVVAQLVR